MTEVDQSTDNVPTEEEVLMAAWEALDGNTQGEFLSKLPPEYRAKLLAHAGRAAPPKPQPRSRLGDA